MEISSNSDDPTGRIEGGEEKFDIDLDVPDGSLAFLKYRFKPNEIKKVRFRREINDAKLNHVGEVVFRVGNDWLLPNSQRSVSKKPMGEEKEEDISAIKPADRKFAEAFLAVLREWKEEDGPKTVKECPDPAVQAACIKLAALLRDGVRHGGFRIIFDRNELSISMLKDGNRYPTVKNRDTVAGDFLGEINTLVQYLVVGPKANDRDSINTEYVCQTSIMTNARRIVRFLWEIVGREKIDQWIGVNITQSMKLKIAIQLEETKDTSAYAKPDDRVLRVHVFEIKAAFK